MAATAGTAGAVTRRQQGLLLDEMLSGEIAAQLRAKGHDVLAVVEDPGLIGMPDEELLVHAATTRRCLVTANVRDFASIHASWSSQGRRHDGIVYLVHRAFPSDRSFLGAVINGARGPARRWSAAGRERRVLPLSTQRLTLSAYQVRHLRMYKGPLAAIAVRLPAWPRSGSGKPPQLLGVSDDTVRRWAEAGRLPTVTEGGRLAVEGAALAAFATELAAIGRAAGGPADGQRVGAQPAGRPGHPGGARHRDGTGRAAGRPVPDRLADEPRGRRRARTCSRASWRSPR